MKYLFFNYILVFSFLGVAISQNQFIIKEKNAGQVIIELSIGEISIEDDNNYHEIISDSKGKTQSIGEPELPTYTFNYSVKRDKDYNIQLELNEYTIYEDIICCIMSTSI